MDIDKIIELAESIASEFKPVDKPRTEWNKWAEYFRRTKCLSKSLDLADNLSNSLMLRDDPKEVYKVISRTVRSKIKGLSSEEISQVFGFVSWKLTSFGAKGGGGKKHEKSPRGNFRRQPRRGDRGYR